MLGLQDIYQKLWQSLIKPTRIPYSEEDLGGRFQFLENGFATRLDFELTNVLREKFTLSVYMPCDSGEKIISPTGAVIYLHTHNGSRIEPLGMLSDVIDKKMCLITFDFRACGKSTGEFVTLGWLEALDLNEVIRFVREEVKVTRIVLWGRSMGGAASVFYLSPKWREEISNWLAEKNGTKIDWVPRSAVDVLVVDSCFSSLREAVLAMVRSKVFVPELLIDLALGVLGGKVKEKTGVSLSLLEPIKHVSQIKTPTYMIVGNEDEMISQNHFHEMFQTLAAEIKHSNVFAGSHGGSRPESIIRSVLDFAIDILAQKNIYNRNKSMTMISQPTPAQKMGSVLARNVPVISNSKINPNPPPGNSQPHQANHQYVRSKSLRPGSTEVSFFMDGQYIDQLLKEKNISSHRFDQIFAENKSNLDKLKELSFHVDGHVPQTTNLSLRSSTRRPITPQSNQPALRPDETFFDGVTLTPDKKRPHVPEMQKPYQVLYEPRNFHEKPNVPNEAMQEQALYSATLFEPVRLEPEKYSNKTMGQNPPPIVKTPTPVNSSSSKPRNIDQIHLPLPFEYFKPQPSLSSASNLNTTVNQSLNKSKGKLRIFDDVPAKNQPYSKDSFTSLPTTILQQKVPLLNARTEPELPKSQSQSYQNPLNDIYFSMNQNPSFRANPIEKLGVSSQPKWNLDDLPDFDEEPQSQNRHQGFFSITESERKMYENEPFIIEPRSLTRLASDSKFGIEEGRTVTLRPTKH